MRIRNVVFSSILCIFILGPVGLYIAQNELELNLPSWLTTENVMYLEGTTNTSDISDYLSREAFLNGQFQDAFSVSLGNYIPAKTNALLSSAALQRFAITVSNSLFRWDCYPTYYGEVSALYVPEGNLLVAWPIQNAKEYQKGTESFCDRIEGFANSHPDKTVCIVVPDYSGMSVLNPATKYLSNCWMTYVCRDILVNRLEDLPNVYISCELYGGYQDYTNNFYRTDHHWNGYGALEAYTALSEDLTLKPIEATSEVEGLSQLKENGSLSRSGLMLLNQEGREPAFDFGSLAVTEGEASCDALDKDGVDVAKEQGALFEFGFYGAWYGGSDPIVIANKDDESGHNALVIGDSYAQAFRWLIAESYQNTYADINRKPRDDETLSSRMDEINSDVVYFVLYANKFASLYEDNEEYLK